VTAAGAALFGHAFGERYDSPVPLRLFVLGGAVVVLLSFLLVYRSSVGAAPPDAEADDVTVVPGPGRVAGGLSVAVLALLVAVGFAGDQTVENNLLPIVFWLVVWVAVPLLVGLLGDFTGSVNPFAALARLGDDAGLRRRLLGTPRPLGWPRVCGWWIAVLLFAVVVLGELVVNTEATLPKVTAAGLLVYALVCLTGGLVVGADAWGRHAELFTLLYAAWGRLGYWRFRAPGRRGFGGGLDARFTPRLSRLLFVLLLLAAVTFDGFLSTPQWDSLRDSLVGEAEPNSATARLSATVAFVLITALMFGLFAAFASWTARAGGRSGAPLPSLAVLLPSLLPIALGYQLAHYLQYIAINGQLLFPLLGDPMGRGWSFLPYPFSSSYRIDAELMPIKVVWYVQLVVIVAAHVVAVIVAHRHLAWAASSERLARRSEWPWLFAMVGYTMLSLWLLAQPLIEHEVGH
jgi:hypothetical protein